MEKVILVNEKDEEMGEMEKMEAHRSAKLHRALSVFIFNENGDMLLQQRASDKYHSAGLWTNACCSHPRPGERTEVAAHRRLQEEMGLDAELKFIGSFLYRSEFENGLTEHELDHVFTGKTESDPEINPEEAQAFVWKAMDEIKADLKKKPDRYTTWFKIAVERFF
jgi:isopentenyl-diphosphate delta-isomerase